MSLAGLELALCVPYLAVLGWMLADGRRGRADRRRSRGDV